MGVAKTLIGKQNGKRNVGICIIIHTLSTVIHVKFKCKELHVNFT